MKLATIVLAMVAVLGVTNLTMAKESSAGKAVKGIFERMQGDTMILSSVSKDGTKTETPVVTTKDTKVTIDGETKTIADLTQGMKVKVKTPNGLATEITVRTKTKAPTTKPSGTK